MMIINKIMKISIMLTCNNNDDNDNGYNGDGHAR